MRRFFLIWIAGVLFLATAVSAALAQETRMRRNIDGDIDSVRDISDISGQWGAGYRFGWIDEGGGPDVDHQHSLNLTYGLSRYLALQMEGAVATNDEYETELYSLFGDLQLRSPMDRFAPYIFVGFGIQNPDSDGFFESWDDKYLWRTGAGMEFFITPGMALNAEGIREIEGGDGTSDSWQFRAGMKFYFL